MTCIVGWTENNNVWIGGDSAGANSLSLTVRKDSKVFVNGEMVFGCTSSFRMIQLLRYSLKIPEQSKKKTDEEYMCTDFINAVSKLLESKKYATVKNNEIRIGVFLVGYKGELYEVEGDLQVGSSVLNYNAVGSGARVALGSLHSLAKHKIKPKDRVIKALEAATEFSTGVRPPFNIIKLK